MGESDKVIPADDPNAKGRWSGTKLVSVLPVVVVLALIVVIRLVTGSEPRLGPQDGFDLPGVDTGRVAVGDFAPDFSLMSYAGTITTLSDFRRDKNVVLVFYRGHW